MRSIARALTLAGFSSEAKLTPSNETPLPPVWQYWHRTPSDKENSRMRWVSSARPMSLGKNCRFWIFHSASGFCAVDGAAISREAMTTRVRHMVPPLIAPSLSRRRRCRRVSGTARLACGVKRSGGGLQERAASGEGDRHADQKHVNRNLSRPQHERRVRDHRDS